MICINQADFRLKEVVRSSNTLKFDELIEHICSKLSIRWDLVDNGILYDCILISDYTCSWDMPDDVGFYIVLIQGNLIPIFVNSAKNMHITYQLYPLISPQSFTRFLNHYSSVLRYTNSYVYDYDTVLQLFRLAYNISIREYILSSEGRLVELRDNDVKLIMILYRARFLGIPNKLGVFWPEVSLNYMHKLMHKHPYIFRYRLSDIKKILSINANIKIVKKYGNLYRIIYVIPSGNSNDENIFLLSVGHNKYVRLLPKYKHHAWMF